MRYPEAHGYRACVCPVFSFLLCHFSYSQLLPKQTQSQLCVCGVAYLFRATFLWARPRVVDGLPQPCTKAPGLVLDHVMHFKNHVAKVHKVNLRPCISPLLNSFVLRSSSLGIGENEGDSEMLLSLQKKGGGGRGRNKS
jgi:hypothetical protein